MIGSVSVNLETLSRGTVKHKLILRDAFQPKGVIHFEVVMQSVTEVTISIQKAQIKFLPIYSIDTASSGECQLRYFGSGTKQVRKSLPKKLDSSMKWNATDLELLWLSERTLQKLHDDFLTFKLVPIRGKNMKEKTVCISLFLYSLFLKKPFLRFKACRVALLPF